MSGQAVISDMQHCLPRAFASQKLIMEGLLAVWVGAVLAGIAAVGITFDWTISLGTLLAAITVLLGIGGAAWRKSISDSKIVDKVDGVVKEMAAVKIETAAQFGAINGQLSTLTILQVEQKNDRQRLAAIEQENRELAKRLLELERDSRRKNGNG